MSLETRSGEVFRFGAFEVDVRAGEMRKQGVRIKLQEQPFRVLTILLLQPGVLVTRDELRSRIWAADTFVDFDNSLNTSINKLREALGDSAESPRFIETLPRRGYRFIAPVSTPEPVKEPVAPAPVIREAILNQPVVPEHREVAGAAGNVSSSAHIAGGPALLTVIKNHKLGLVAGLILVGLMLGAVLYSTHRLPSGNVSQAKVTHKQFTFLGNAYEPAISPDGMFVAYVSKKPGEEQKLMVQSSDGAKLELARATIISSPRWSPDGSEVLFLSREPALSKLEPTAKSWGISVVSRLGGVVRPIFTAVLACWFTPDGSQIVVANPSESSGFKGVRLVNKVTGEMKEVRLSEYEWLMDIDCSARAGLILAVTVTSERSQIRIFRPDGSEQRKLVEERDLIYSARWSPTGESIFYLHGRGSTEELSKLFIRKTAEPAVLADGLQTGGDFTLSADGSRLAYTRDDYHLNLLRVDFPAAGKRAKPEISRLTSGTSYYGAPSYSPDGRWISFALGPTRTETNIFKMQVAGGAPIQLTFFEHAMTDSPAWSPDSQRIAFINDQNGAPRVWMISANGGVAQPLQNTNASDSQDALAWWPSHDIVYQQPGNRNFLRINDKTHEEKPIIQHAQGWVPYRPAFSPDGKKMAVFWNRGHDDVGLWIISPEPYSETFLQSGFIQPFGWSPDGKYIYATRGGGTAQRIEIIRVQVATPNQLSPVVTLPVDVGGGFGEVFGARLSLSPDGQSIVVAADEEKSDVWLMENFDPSAHQ
jgi:Tol biopolymer transport system component/DNA-binding winged helix-turn-helix (wHTH) protein